MQLAAYSADALPSQCNASCALYVAKLAIYLTGPPCSSLPRDNGRTTSHSSHRRPEALSSEQEEAGRHTVTHPSAWATAGTGTRTRRPRVSYAEAEDNGLYYYRVHSVTCTACMYGNCLTIYAPGNAGYYNNGPPVMAPPPYQYAAPPPPRREPSFLEGW